MMALGPSICSDEEVCLNRHYLLRYGCNQYCVVSPTDWTGREMIPYKEAFFLDQMTGKVFSHKDVCELAAIY